MAEGGATVKRYRSPAPVRSPLPRLERTTPGPPRDFAEWTTLRRWGKLPEAERDVPGYILRMAREGAGLTQRELAVRLGVS